MIAASLAWIVLSVIVAGIVGRVLHAGAVDVQSACNQNCLQGRDCSCAVPVDGETPP